MKSFLISGVAQSGLSYAKMLRCVWVAAILAPLLLAQSVSVTAPAIGKTIPSPVHMVATANGGGYPVSAISIYVDNQPLYSTAAASVNTFLSLPAGSHQVVATAWNTAGQAASQSLSISVAGVTITSPSAGATVASPVRVAATATALSGRVIETMNVYVDGKNAYTVAASSLNTSLAVAAGVHNIKVQAIDSAGIAHSRVMSITVGSSQSVSYQNNFNATSKWVSQFSQADGAILYVPGIIEPYFANIAAIGMTKDPNRMPQVVAWMNWYINHLNWPDKWGLYGTMYDYTVSNGIETPTESADSTDSYAATFLTLAWNAWQSGDADARSYLLGRSYQLDVIGGVLIQTQQSDGLTWAKPDYQIKYLMDNCEAYRGLRDLASLYQNAFGDASKAAYYNAAAAAMQHGILGMWMNGSWAVYKNWYGNLIAPNMATWYADASAQVFPVLMGVVNSSDSRAQKAYAALNAAWPEWPTLSFNSQDPFPWCLIVDGAAAMGDQARVATYIGSIQNKY
ncbi:MAG: Ig-like domain-containing protein, partial [Terriglobales bacterium]